MKATTLSISASLKPLKKGYIIEDESLWAKNLDKSRAILQNWKEGLNPNMLPQEFHMNNWKPGGERRSSKPDSTWVQGRLVPRNRVLIAADIHLLANHKRVQLTFHLCFTRSTKNQVVNKVRLVKEHTSSKISSPLAPLMATGLRLRSTWTMWQSVPPVTMLYLKLKAS